MVKTILSPRDEAIDLDESEYKRALEETNKKRATNDKGPKGTPDGPEIRKVRGENPKRALLLIYPLSPKKAELTFQHPDLWHCHQLPRSKSGRVARYRFNKVEQRLLEIP